MIRILIESSNRFYFQLQGILIIKISNYKWRKRDVWNTIHPDYNPHTHVGHCCWLRSLNCHSCLPVRLSVCCCFFLFSCCRFRRIKWNILNYRCMITRESVYCITKRRWLSLRRAKEQHGRFESANHFRIESNRTADSNWNRISKLRRSLVWRAI